MIMKRIFFTIVAMLLPLMASAGLSDQLFYIYDSSTKTATLTRNQDWACYTGHIIIPSKVTYNNVEYIVTAIGAYALEGSREWDASPSSVTIPSSVKRINYNAFEHSELNTIFYLGDISAWCNISFGSSPSSYKLYVNNRLVDNLVIPSSVTSIGERTFSGCKSLTSITIPNSVTSIGDFAFEGCTGLTSIVSLNSNPPSVQYSNAFSNVDKNNCVVGVPKGSLSAYKGANGWKDFAKIVEIGVGFTFEVDGINYKVGENNTVSVVSKNSKYSGDVVIPNQVSYLGTTYSVISIGDWAFEGCHNLTSVTIPNSVISIGDWAFSGCGLTSVTIPNSVTSIGSYAFGGLSSVVIGKNVKSIGPCALGYWCDDNPTTVISLIENPFSILGWEYGDINSVFSRATFDEATLYVPVGTIEKYKATSGWQEFKNIREMIVGDVNLDFKVNKADLNATVDFIMGKAPEGFYESLADLNGDDKVDAADVVKLVDILNTLTR